MVLSKKCLNIIASPWSPPAMYKNNRSLIRGKLKHRYYDAYAEYLNKYIEAYKNNNINVNYITMQNEPFARQIWESCRFNIKSQKEFIYNNLLPKLNNTKILLWDHNKDNIVKVVDKLYKENALIGGVGFHYYTGSYFDNIRKLNDALSDIRCNKEYYSEIFNL